MSAEHAPLSAVAVDPLVMRLALVADAIEEAARTLRREAEHLERLAEKQRQRMDSGPASSAIAAITQIPAACRCDVISSRTADAFMLAHNDKGNAPQKAAHGETK